MRLALAVAGLTTVLISSAGARAPDPAIEISIAQAHAFAAAEAGELDEVHTELRQVVNCLVGPGDKQFDPTTLNPCAKAGRGAIPDTPEPASKRRLQDAVEMAELGIVATDFNTAIGLATGAAGSIKASSAPPAAH
jgi:hypothetical protein